MSGSTWKPLKGSVAMFQYDWITAAPLVVADAGAVAIAAAKMKAAVNNYDQGALETYDDQFDKIAHAVDWNERIGNTIAILDIITGSDRNLIYTVLGTPVGIICLSDNDPSHVSYLVTHPGTENAGGIMLEAAADYSQSRGHGGKLDLYSYDGKSSRAYRAMGFTKADNGYDSGGTMVLEPTTSALWHFTGGHWRLAKYEALRFFSTRTKPVPPIPVKR
jgi:hypothetical protein